MRLSFPDFHIAEPHEFSLVYTFFWQNTAHRMGNAIFIDQCAVQIHKPSTFCDHGHLFFHGVLNRLSHCRIFFQIRREKLLNERFSRFLKAIDAAGDGAEMNRYYLEQLSTHPDLMNAEVLDVLRELSEVATLAVVSNGVHKVQTRRLAESGVSNFMEDVFISEKLGCEKPGARIFDAALRALGVENREHVLMVGDSLSSDVQGGVNAGLDTCWYNPNHAENPGKVVPTYEISSLALSAGDGAGGTGQCGPEESPPPAVMLCGLCERLENEQC